MTGPGFSPEAALARLQARGARPSAVLTRSVSRRISLAAKNRDADGLTPLQATVLNCIRAHGETGIGSFARIAAMVECCRPKAVRCVVIAIADRGFVRFDQARKTYVAVEL